MSITADEIPAIEINDLQTYFFTKAGVIKAVDCISLSIPRGKILGLVGESGSGKTVTGFSVLGLVDPPGRVVGGSVKIEGQEVLDLEPRALQSIRGRKVSMIFQDPMMTLNPVMRIDSQMTEAILTHEKVTIKAARARALEALEKVGIPAAAERLKAHPHQLSGGMRQRVAIATAILNRPAVIIADEPTTALDVTIQAQILGEIRSLAAEFGTAIIWITHDLSVVAGLADTIAVMYAGKIVEKGAIDDVLDRPLHPYTRGLLDSVPQIGQARGRLRQFPGMTPSLLNLPKGCPVQPRCMRASAQCQIPPELLPQIGSQFVSCHHPIGTRDTDQSFEDKLV
ncbi:MAG: ABC transporter ATP-binding protein [Paracoccaceae bacterium]|nr:ABC transporter ATP-binding protein [Paracoccaceae bacterium]